MTIKIEELQELSRRLQVLVVSPEPGCWTWQKAVGNILEKLQYDTADIEYRGKHLTVASDGGKILLSDDIAREISNAFNLRGT